MVSDVHRGADYVAGIADKPKMEEAPPDHAYTTLDPSPLAVPRVGTDQGNRLVVKISIVTPVHNDVRVSRALDSVLGQQLDHVIEPIVVDAGSTDGTLEVLEPYRSRLAVCISEPDCGIYDGMNKGVRRATGDVVGILNADDRYSDEFVLRDVLDVFENSVVDACYGDMVYVDANDRVVRYWKSGVSHRLNWYLGWMPPHPTMFVRRDVYERFGTFDLDFPIASDYELMLRLLLRHRVKTRYINRVLVHMATGGNSNRSLAAVIKGNLEVAQAWRHNKIRGGQLVPLLKPARKLVQFFRPPHGSKRVESPF